MWRLRKQSVSPSPLRKTCCTSSCCQSLFSFSLEKGACVSVCVCMCLCVCVCWAFHGAFCKCVGGAVTWLWHSVAHSSGKKKKQQHGAECRRPALFWKHSSLLHGCNPPSPPPSFCVSRSYNLDSGIWNTVPVSGGPLPRYGHSLAAHQVRRLTCQREAGETNYCKKAKTECSFGRREGTQDQLLSRQTDLVAFLSHFSTWWKHGI